MATEFAAIDGEITPFDLEAPIPASASFPAKECLIDIFSFSAAPEALARIWN